jgi:hypothetical protein
MEFAEKMGRYSVQKGGFGRNIMSSFNQIMTGPPVDRGGVKIK